MLNAAAVHVPTLAATTALVGAVLGGLLLFSWSLARQMSALRWWSFAYLSGTAGFGLLSLRGSIGDFLSIEIANALLVVGAGLVWGGASAFEERRPRPIPILLAAAIWIVACQFGFFANDIAMRIVLASAILASFFARAAYELWRGRRVQLVSRWPAIAILSVIGAVLLARIPTVTVFSAPPGGLALAQSSWFGWMVVNALVFAVVLAFIFLAMTKEREELRHKQAARTDPLTGLLNRRAFLSEAQTCLAAAARSGTPVTVLAFDLDRFKRINDQFGHARGDEALVAFAAVLERSLRSGDVAGRFGGEEFVAVLPGLSGNAAAEIAEEIRGDFEDAGRMLGGRPIGATVSIGIAVRPSPASVTELLGEADEAVYRAKAAGRNCVATLRPVARPPEQAAALPHPGRPRSAAA